jgi:shikimate dehydrogenase
MWAAGSQEGGGRTPRGGFGQRAYLFAHPVGHSISPALHAAAFVHCGIPGSYAAVDVPPEDLPARVQSLRGEGVLGANLSLPLKEQVLELVDTCGDEVRAIGAANTVVHRGGRLIARNTDASGLLAALEAAGCSGAEQALVIGAGGAARAAAYALASWGSCVHLINRGEQRAVRVREELGLRGLATSRPEELPWAEIGLIVQATSAGLNDPESAPLELPALPQRPVVMDMIYRPRWTKLLRQAAAQGCPLVFGLEMLLHQAAGSFALWTGLQVPTAVLREAARAELGPGQL